MTNPTTAEPITAPPKMAFALTPVSAAAVILAAVAEIQAAWEELVDTEVRIVDDSVDRKDAQTFKKLLLDQSSMRTLHVIWKESPFVSETDLSTIGLAKAFDAMSPINAHALALELTENAKHLDRNQMAVRKLAKAAIACGLIERHDVGGCNAKELRGTARLDALMRRYAEQLTEIFANVSILLPEAI